MDVTQDQLLTTILVAVIVSMAVIALLLELRRFRRNRQVLSTPYQSPAVDRAMSMAYTDPAATSAWSVADGPLGSGNGEVAEPDDSDRGDEPDLTAAVAAAQADAGGSERSDGGAPPAHGDGHDPITGLLDATTFSQRVADEEMRVRRYGRPATVAMLELEGLDRLVERLGPDAADRVIPAVADTLRRLARGSDHVARVDTGRFAVLLPETDEVAAINYLERVRRACDLWLESGAIAMRLSIGWAGTSGEPPLSEAQRTATERMFVESRRNARRAD